MIELADTHCHIQSAGQAEGERGTRELWAKVPELTADKLINNAAKADVTRMVCVGCDLEDSRLAVDFAQNQKNCWASIGIHPHEAKHYVQVAETKQPAEPIAGSPLSAQSGVADSSAPSPYHSYGSVRASSAPSSASEPELSAALKGFTKLVSRSKIVAVGECGLDYYYNHSPKEAQIAVLKFQIELALKHNLPIIFHVREAFDDFWPVFDSYSSLRGVVHSFTDSAGNMKKAIERGLYVGVNGIATFTKDEKQLDVYRSIPLEKLLLETDAPFLAPAPHRGSINEPKNIRVVAEYLAKLRGESLETLAQTTTSNARRLFGI